MPKLPLKNLQSAIILAMPEGVTCQTMTVVGTDQPAREWRLFLGLEHGDLTETVEVCWREPARSRGLARVTLTLTAVDAGGEPTEMFEARKDKFNGLSSAMWELTKWLGDIWTEQED